MCSLAITPSSDSPDQAPWAARVAMGAIDEPSEQRSVSLCFCDLRIRAEDLTTVGEALAECTPEEMFDAVMRHEVKWRVSAEGVGSRARHRLIGRIASALDVMRSFEQAAPASPFNSEGFVGPLFRFVSESQNEGYKYEVSAAVFAENEVDAVRRLVEEGVRRARTWDELRTLLRDARSGAESSQRVRECLHSSASIISRMSWERVLALPLWLPADLSVAEHHAILSKVFWAMTYRGFVQSEWQRSPAEESLEDAKSHVARLGELPWPIDPVSAVLEHNCWVDTLEAWDALFAVIFPSETRL